MIPLLWPATRTRSPSSSKSSSEGWRPPDRAVRGRFKPKDNMTLYKTVFQHSPYRIISANPMDIFSFEPKRAAGLYVDHCQRNIPFLHFLLFFHSSPFSIQIWLTLFIFLEKSIHGDFWEIGSLKRLSRLHSSQCIPQMEWCIWQKNLDLSIFSFKYIDQNKATGFNKYIFSQC